MNKNTPKYPSLVSATIQVPNADGSMRTVRYLERDSSTLLNDPEIDHGSTTSRYSNNPIQKNPFTRNWGSTKGDLTDEEWAEEGLTDQNKYVKVALTLPNDAVVFYHGPKQKAFAIREKAQIEYLKSKEMYRYMVKANNPNGMFVEAFEHDQLVIEQWLTKERELPSHLRARPLCRGHFESKWLNRVRKIERLKRVMGKVGSFIVAKDEKVRIDMLMEKVWETKYRLGLPNFVVYRDPKIHGKPDPQRWGRKTNDPKRSNLGKTLGKVLSHNPDLEFFHAIEWAWTPLKEMHFVPRNQDLQTKEDYELLQAHMRYVHWFAPKNDTVRATLKTLDDLLPMLTSKEDFPLDRELNARFLENVRYIPAMHILSADDLEKREELRKSLWKLLFALRIEELSGCLKPQMKEGRSKEWKNRAAVAEKKFWKVLMGTAKNRLPRLFPKGGTDTIYEKFMDWIANNGHNANREINVAIEITKMVYKYWFEYRDTNVLALNWHRWYPSVPTPTYWCSALIEDLVSTKSELPETCKKWINQNLKGILRRMHNCEAWGDGDSDNQMATSHIEQKNGISLNTPFSVAMFCTNVWLQAFLHWYKDYRYSAYNKQRQAGTMSECLVEERDNWRKIRRENRKLDEAASLMSKAVEHKATRLHWSASRQKMEKIRLRKEGIATPSTISPILAEKLRKSKHQQQMLQAEQKRQQMLMEQQIQAREKERICLCASQAVQSWQQAFDNALVYAIEALAFGHIHRALKSVTEQQSSDLAFQNDITTAWEWKHRQNALIMEQKQAEARLLKWEEVRQNEREQAQRRQEEKEERIKNRRTRRRNQRLNQLNGGMLWFTLNDFEMHDKWEEQYQYNMAVMGLPDLVIEHLLDHDEEPDMMYYKGNKLSVPRMDSQYPHDRHKHEWVRELLRIKKAIRMGWIKGDGHLEVLYRAPKSNGQRGFDLIPIRLLPYQVDNLIWQKTILMEDQDIRFVLPEPYGSTNKYYQQTLRAEEKRARVEEANRVFQAEQRLRRQQEMDQLVQTFRTQWLAKTLEEMQRESRRVQYEILRIPQVPTLPEEAPDRAPRPENEEDLIQKQQHAIQQWNAEIDSIVGLKGEERRQALERVLLQPYNAMPPLLEAVFKVHEVQTEDEYIDWTVPHTITRPTRLNRWSWWWNGSMYYQCKDWDACYNAFLQIIPIKGLRKLDCDIEDHTPFMDQFLMERVAWMTRMMGMHGFLEQSAVPTLHKLLHSADWQRMPIRNQQMMLEQIYWVMPKHVHPLIEWNDTQNYLRGKIEAYLLEREGTRKQFRYACRTTAYVGANNPQWSESIEGASFAVEGSKEEIRQHLLKINSRAICRSELKLPGKIYWSVAHMSSERPDVGPLIKKESVVAIVPKGSGKAVPGTMEKRIHPKNGRFPIGPP